MCMQKRFEVVVVHRETGIEETKTVTAGNEEEVRQRVNDDGYLAGPIRVIRAPEPQSKAPRIRKLSWALLGILAVLVLTEGGLRVSGRSLLHFVNADARLVSRLKKTEAIHEEFAAIIKDEQMWLRDGRGVAAAWLAVQSHVRERLKSPTTASFPTFEELNGPDEVVVWSAKDRSFLVSGYVDSQNSYGAMIRTKFVAEIAPRGGQRPLHPEDPASWSLEVFVFDN